MTLRGGAPEPLSAILHGMVKNVVITPDHEIQATWGLEAPEVCRICHDVGYVRADVFPGHPDFGKLLECPGCAESRRSERTEALMRRLWSNDADDWLHYRDMTIDTFPWTESTLALRPTLERWLDDEPSWLMLYGQHRRGKTGLAISLIRELIGRNQAGLLVTVDRLLARIKATYGADRDGSESDVLDTLIGVPVLLLDDLGVEGVSPWVMEKFYSVINGRLLGHRRTIITTNLEPEAALERLGDRVLWRVIEMCGEYMLRVDGPNLSARKLAGKDKSA